MSNREAPLDLEATAWLEARVGKVAQIQALAGDLSPRRYWRLGGTGLLLAAHPPGDLESLRRFEQTSAMLTAHGVRVPRLEAIDCDRGWLLVEDLGPVTVHEAFGEHARSSNDPSGVVSADLSMALRQGAEVWGRIRRVGPLEAPLLPPLDAPLLAIEVERTVTVALLPLGYLAPAEVEAFRRDVRLLCEEIAAQLEPAHRDFMVRNLVPVAGGELGVLDHQDLRLAPRAYDLGSLLVDTVLLSSAQRIELEEELVEPSLRRAWAGAAAQRCLKILGTFVSCADRGVRRHLVLVPRTLQQLARLAPELPTLGPWCGHFERWADAASVDPRFRP